MIDVLASADIQAALDDTQLLLYRDRRRAHATLFGGDQRKKYPTPDFHWEMIDDWHSSIPKLLQIGFAGCAKTTLGEEGVTINALFREFSYLQVISSIDEIAEMRVHAIKALLESESVLEIFGNLRTKQWDDGHIELSTGIVIQAIGRNHTTRGAKAINARPDLMWFDDFEDKKAVANEAQIKKTLERFDGEILGRADQPRLKIRYTTNDMGQECLSNKLSVSPGWTTRRYPWIVNGKSVWEARFPLAQCLQTKMEMYARGSGDEYEREYMCNSFRPEAKTFRDEFLKVESRVRVYEPTYAMVVPEPQKPGLAITKCAASVWSWIGDKIIVWECWSKNLAADKIIAECERIDREYAPVKLGITQEAYDDWARASLTLPNVTPIKRRGEDLDFVRALQPFFVGKYIQFAVEPREAWPQFTAFPNGPMEAPMSLAFALHPDMRPTATVYEDFSTANVMPDLLPHPGPMMLALNADEKQIAGALCQITGSGLAVFADWLMRGDDIDLAARMVQQANLTAQRRCQIIIPPHHFERFKSRLPDALRKIGIQTSAGGSIEDGRRELRKMLREQSRGLPRVLVSDQARWTANGFLSGYTLGAEDGPYKLVCEALESLTALAAFGDMLDDTRTNATARDGRSYISARPVKQHA